MIDYDDWGEKPVPVIDPESAAFWDAASEGDLVVQRCGSCDERQFYPREVCRHCWSRDLEFEAVSGTGEVYSFTECHVPGQPGYGDDVPYVVALVELDLPAENPSGRSVRLFSHVAEPSTDALAVGLPVEVTFEQVSDDPEIHLPVFRPR